MASRQNLQIEVPVKLNLAMQEAQSQIQAFKNQLKNEQEKLELTLFPFG